MPPSGGRLRRLSWISLGFLHTVQDEIYDYGGLLTHYCTRYLPCRRIAGTYFARRNKTRRMCPNSIPLIVEYLLVSRTKFRCFLDSSVSLREESKQKQVDGFADFCQLECGNTVHVNLKLDCCPL